MTRWWLVFCLASFAPAVVIGEEAIQAVRVLAADEMEAKIEIGTAFVVNGSWAVVLMAAFSIGTLLSAFVAGVAWSRRREDDGGAL